MMDVDKPDQKKVFFRNNLVGGFNKADVVAYIAQQNKEQIAELETLRGELAVSERGRSEAEEKLTALEEALAATNAELSQTRAENDALRVELDRQMMRISALETSKNEADHRFHTLFSELRDAAGELCAVAAPSAADDTRIRELTQKIDELTAENRALRTSLEKLDGFRSAIKNLLSGSALLSAQPDGAEESEAGAQ